MLDRMHPVPGAQELLDRAFAKAGRIEVPDPVKYHRVRKTLAARIQCTVDVLEGALGRLLRSIGDMDRLRDYEAEVLDVLVGLAELRRAVTRVTWAREKVMDMGREHLQRMERIRRPEEFHQLFRRHYGRVSSVLGDVDDALEFLREARARARLLPTVGPDWATVVVAGFPNVGKTSLLRAWTGSRAEVAPYAFTTKHAEVGHFEVPDPRGGPPRRVQVVDTPGLLDRPDTQRNQVERQAVAALRHAADAVLFLIDPTETAGFTRADQEHLLEQVRGEMVGLPFLVAETKADLGRSGSDRPKISTASGEGVEALRQAVLALLPLEEPELEEDPLERWLRRGKGP